MPPNLERGANTAGITEKSHTVPTAPANTGRRKVIPLTMGQSSSEKGWEDRFGGDHHMISGAGAGCVCCTPSWLLKHQGRNRSTSLGVEFLVSRLIS